jgi:hypothetical protein
MVGFELALYVPKFTAVPFFRTANVIVGLRLGVMPTLFTA